MPLICKVRASNLIIMWIRLISIIFMIFSIEKFNLWMDKKRKFDNNSKKQKRPRKTGGLWNVELSKNGTDCLDGEKDKRASPKGSGWEEETVEDYSGLYHVWREIWKDYDLSFHISSSLH